MSAPRLLSCWFGAGADDQWPRLARVLAFSARQHCPDWQIDVRTIVPPPVRGPIPTAAYSQNTQKLEYWAQAIAELADGDRVALLDADTLVVASLDPVWDRPFEVAYTVRAEGFRFPLNAGVVFVQVTARSRAFLQQWCEENRRMLVDRQRHQVWRKRYGGINQAALGALLEHGDRHGAQLVKLPCREWNCEDSAWETFGPQTRILHVKSALRRAIFLRTHVSQRVMPLVKLWRDRERAALAAEPPATPPGAATSRPFPRRPRGRPRGPETVVTSVRIPQGVYDVYCRRAVVTHQSVHALLQERLAAGIRVAE